MCAMCVYVFIEYVCVGPYPHLPLTSPLPHLTANFFGGGTRHTGTHAFKRTLESIRIVVKI